jgi:hypothetical protein
MNGKIIMIILITSALIVGGCGKQSNANNNTSQSPPPVQAEPFHGQVYKSIDGRNALTLTSKDECDLTKDGTTLPCKYVKQADAVRVIATIMGTPQVLYFRFVDKGLQANDGQILLAPQQYADAVAILQQQEKARQKEEAERQKEAQERQRREQQIAQENQDCTIETITNSSFPLFLRTPQSRNGISLMEGTITITDVSIVLDLIYHRDDGSTQPGGCAVNFSHLLKIGNVGVDSPANSFSLEFNSIQGRGKSYYNGDDLGFNPAGHSFYYGNIFGFKSDADARAAHDALVTALNSWKGKFPHVVQQ